MATKFKFNIAGFAQLRNHPALVGAMSSAASRGSAGTPFDVEVVVWPHSGISAGPRTSVQIWARSWDARRQVSRSPGELVAVLGRSAP